MIPHIIIICRAHLAGDAGRGVARDHGPQELLNKLELSSNIGAVLNNWSCPQQLELSSTIGVVLNNWSCPQQLELSSGVVKHRSCLKLEFLNNYRSCFLRTFPIQQVKGLAYCSRSCCFLVCCFLYYFCVFLDCHASVLFVICFMLCMFIVYMHIYIYIYVYIYICMYVCIYIYTYIYIYIYIYTYLYTHVYTYTHNNCA